MSPAKMVALVFIILGIILFVLVGLDAVHPDKLNLVALGLGAVWTGWAIDHYIP